MNTNSTALNELSKLWMANKSKIATISKNTPLWHCGRTPSIEHLNDNSPLWTTRNPDRSDEYAGSAREPALWTTNLPTKLDLVVVRDLQAADFNLQSLLEFTQNFCSCQHDIMKRMLHDWMQMNNFDAIVRLNSDPDEVLVAHPSKDLNLILATRL